MGGVRFLWIVCLFFFQFVSKLSTHAVEIRRDTFKLPALYFQLKILSVLTTYIIIIIKSLLSEYNWQLAYAVTEVKRAGNTLKHTQKMAVISDTFPFAQVLKADG